MKKLALLVLALELAVCGCGNNTPTNTITTSAGGNWEAQLLGAQFPAGQLNFVTTFKVTSTIAGTAQPLDISGVSFFNSQGCFAGGLNSETATGSATLNTASGGTVSGSMTLTITSVGTPTTQAGNVLTLDTTNGGVSGNSNGTTSTTGTLTNGVVWGTWTLQSSDQACNGGGSTAPTGTFIMCQGKNSCTIP